ncbi:MAG TPA: ABC transporter permease subunit [Chloroflexota bacterium]|jgi:ABC-type transport system involved in multi-copper enzyme maturation permease subunit|nr:ABC transporter permease subunit [Chloroflexota bacterium]
MPLLIIARLTLHEAVRKRLVLAVFVLTVLAIAFTGWGLARFATVTDNQGQPLAHSELILSEATFVILLAWMFSVVLAAGAAFLAAPAVAGDIESGLVQAMLPRPIRRSDLLLGKWLGFTILLVAYAGVTGGATFAVINMVTGYLPPHPALAIAYLVGQSIILLTLSLLCSTRLPPMTGGIVAIVLFGMAWIAGIVTVLGTTFHNQAITTAGTAVGLVLPTDSLWRGAVYSLEPAVVLALRTGVERQGPFYVPLAPTPANLLWALFWALAVLALATFSFRSRDL